MFNVVTIKNPRVVKGLVGLLMLFIWLLVVASSVQAVPNRVQVKVTYDNVNLKYNVNLTWNYTTGDSLYVSTNGSTWTLIPLESPTNGQEFSITDSTQRNSHGVVHYEVRNGTEKKKVNVFPGTGDNYANQHGNYDNNTNTCQNCHASHKSEGARLIKEATIGAMCDTCHSAAVSGGVGSRYMTDIGGVQGSDGKYVQALGGLFGRPTGDSNDTTSPNGLMAGTVNSSDITAVINEVWKEYKVGSETLGSSTSTHALEVYNQAAPGDSVAGRDMSCTACHQGHPNDNNYRLLKSSINTSNIGEIEAYAANDTGTSVSDPVSGMNLLEKGRYVNNMNEFCAQCHSIFEVGEGAASSKGEGQLHYLHPVGVDMTYTSSNGSGQLTLDTKLPLSASNQILCLTCHFAHGTPVADNSIQASNYIANNNSSMLKRRANQAVCEDCHQK